MWFHWLSLEHHLFVWLEWKNHRSFSKLSSYKRLTWAQVEIESSDRREKNEKWTKFGLLFLSSLSSKICQSRILNIYAHFPFAFTSWLPMSMSMFVASFFSSNILLFFLGFLILHELDAIGIWFLHFVSSLLPFFTLESVSGHSIVINSRRIGFRCKFNHLKFPWK